jgi:phage gp16-like protein
MTPNARKSALAKIHIGAQQVGMDEDTRRDMIRRIGGAASGSSADLTDAGIGAVLGHLYGLGFTPSRPAKAGKKPTMTASRQALFNKIDAYLAEAGRSIAYADGIAKRMYRLDKVAWCNDVQLRGVIAALDKNAKKEGRATGG